MLTLLLVLSFVVMAGLAAAGLLLSAEDQGNRPDAEGQGLSDIATIKPR